MTYNITQKEWLDFLDLLHNKLRNANGLKLTQMPALYEISNFMLFRFLDNKNIIGINIPKEDRMENMYKKYATDEKIKEDNKIPYTKDRNSYKLWNAIYNFNNQEEKCLLHRYVENEELLPYLKSSTNKVSAYLNNDKAYEVIQDVLNIIYKKFENIEFDSKFFDMFGSAYEDFKTKACGNGGKQTAQHFTNVYIKKLIINEIKPKHNEIFYEPCAGSGGFIHTADHYVLENEGEEKSKIFKKNIFANECNPEIFRPLILNMLFHNIPLSNDDQNINEEDSLSHMNILKMKNKCDIIATNFPFGMNTKLDVKIHTPAEEYWKILKTGKNYIKSSSAQFVLHIYHSLKENGRTGFVSDRGILNNGRDNKNSWQSKLRKFIFENNNVYKIVLLPEGAFTYTKFATCIIFFKKDEQTKECRIYDAKFKIPKDITSEIYIENEPLKTFTIEELKKNNYDLGLKEEDDNNEEIKEGEWIKLKDIIIFEQKSKHNASIGSDIGEYIFLTSSQKIKYSNINDYKDYKIILGTGGKGSIHYYKDFSCSADNFIFDVNNENNDNYILKFIYYYLFINYNILENGFKGNGLKHISKTYVENIQIPSLSLEHQEEIVKFLDEQFKLYNIEQLIPYTKNGKLFDLLIYKKYEEFADLLHIIYRKIEADLLHIIYRKIEADLMHKKFELDKKAIFKMDVNMVECKEYKLGDICNIEFGTRITKLKDSINNNEEGEKQILQ